VQLLDIDEDGSAAIVIEDEDDAIDDE